MPNFASVLKEEILRLARKEVRQETEALKKASANARAALAELKRRVALLEKQVVQLGKKVPGPAQAAEGEAAPLRFSAKGLAKQRQRLGLTAAEAGTLLGVSAQTVYNWETGKSRPRAAQLPAIAALRRMGKRAAKAQLAPPEA